MSYTKTGGFHHEAKIDLSLSNLKDGSSPTQEQLVGGFTQGGLGLSFLDKDYRTINFYGEWSLETLEQ